VKSQGDYTQSSGKDQGSVGCDVREIQVVILEFILNDTGQQ
jgi:hypothetical protein